MVSHFRHLTVKVFQGKGLADRFIHRLPCHVVPCRHPILFRLIKRIGFLSAAWMFYDRKGIFPAQLIGALAKQSKIGFVVVVMFPVHKRDRVHNKVIVQAVRIQMGSNDYLKPVAPHPLGKSDSDFVCLFGCNLSRFKTLEPVIADDLTFIIPLCFGDHHFLSGRSRITVDTRDKKTLLRLILIGRIFHHIHQSLKVCFRIIGIGSLFRVFGIVNRVVKSAPYIPDLTDCHYPDCLLGSRYFFRTST